MRGLQRLLPALGAGISLTVFAVVMLSIPLGVAEDLDLTTGQLTAWIMALYGVAAVASLALVLRYRQPLAITGNMFVLIFVASLGSALSWQELIGASMVAGALVLALGLFGLTDRLAAWLPAPIVFGVLAGAVLPFFVGLFTAFTEARLVVGIAVLAFVVGRRLLEPPVPAMMTAVVAGVVAATFSGAVEPMAVQGAFVTPTLSMPKFTLGALVTATPVLVVLITLQANVPSMVLLRGQGYNPPERTVEVISGAGTLLGSLLGPIGFSLSLPATALASGRDAGQSEYRHRSIYFVAFAALAIAIFAGLAAELAGVLPRPLLLAFVGLAVIGVLVSALQQVAKGPLLLGPMFAFGISLSDLSLFGLGPFFWALVIGLGVSRLVEAEAWRAVRRGSSG